MAIDASGGGQAGVDGAGRGVSAGGLKEGLDMLHGDEATFVPGGLAQRGLGEAVQFAHGAADGLMQGKEGGRGEQVGLAARAPQAGAQVLDRVFRSEGFDAQASGEARIEGAVSTQGEALVEFWLANEDQGEQGEATLGRLLRAAVPREVAAWGAYVVTPPAE